MGINDFAKANNLARKFENAIEAISRGKGWIVFDGLEKGTITVKVIYDGSIRFEAVQKPKKTKKEPEKTPIVLNLTPIVEKEIEEQEVTPGSQPDGITESE